MAVIGYILLGALALVLLCLCVPAFISLRYRTGEPPEAYLRWLVLKFSLIPPEKPEQPEKAKAKSRPAKKAEKKPAAKKPAEFLNLLGVVLDLLSASKGGAGLILRRFRIYRLRLYLTVAEDDAAETAIAYGRANAAVYSAYALAAGFLNMSRPDIRIAADFLAAEGSVDFELRARLLPIVAVAAGIRIACAFLVKTIVRRKREAGGTEGTGS